MRTRSATYKRDGQLTFAVTAAIASPDSQSTVSGSSYTFTTPDGSVTTELPPATHGHVSEALQFLADAFGESGPERASHFAIGWDLVAAGVHATAKEKGFWDSERNVPEMLALIHSEISEALEALRSGNPLDRDVPEFTNFEVELADAIVRIMDMSKGLNLDVAGALEAKIKFNRTRERLNGKTF